MTRPKAEKIPVEGCPDAPAIGGCNFFSGDYGDDDEGDIAMSGGVLPRDWEFFWRRHARAEPPGPLPEGALAIMRAFNASGDPTKLEPSSIKLENGVTHVAWDCIHTAFPGEPHGRPRYAILVVPGKKLEETIHDVFPAEDLKVFTDGSRDPIKIRPAMKFRNGR